jgi:hypothetical protein
MGWKPHATKGVESRTVIYGFGCTPADCSGFYINVRLGLVLILPAFTRVVLTLSLLLPVLNGMKLLDAFDFMFEAVAGGRGVLARHLSPANLPLLLGAHRLLRLSASKDGPS